ncbi:hypothetical protein [Nocardia tengchongensis]|uniref:hypothetical protein n=1 Tax=Nocardia tengchongensis TaxID=2055889 RepID=UPI0036B31D46
MSARAWVERAIVPGTTTPGAKRKIALYVYLPDDEYRAQRWLRRVLGSRIKLTRVQHRGVQVWQLSPTHLVPLAGALADSYGVVKIRLEILAEMDRCDTKCRDAKANSVWECVCSCAGEHHGGYGIRSDWYQTGRSTLKRFEKTQIDQLIVSAGRIPVRQHVPRPAPIVEPSRYQSPPAVLPPQRRPASVLPVPVAPAAPELRPPTSLPPHHPLPPTATTAHSESASVAPGRRRATHTYAPRPEPSPPARSRRTGAGSTVILAALAAAGAVAVIVGISAMPHDPSTHPTRTNQVGIPLPATGPEHEPVTEVPSARAFPPGCYPLQQGC